MLDMSSLHTMAYYCLIFALISVRFYGNCSTDNADIAHLNKQVSLKQGHSLLAFCATSMKVKQ